jgi:L-lysine exporter family protein LysE/ArgO
MAIAAFTHGFATSAALIVAIGAQNAFVLRQGLARRHVLPVVLVCALSDALLITLGIAGLSAAVRSAPLLLEAARWGGAAFLLAYGALAARRALSPRALAAAPTALAGLGPAIAACLAFTYLNPHTWLDTVVLVGSLGAQQPPGQVLWFGSGAVIASGVWFFSLGFGARLLAPVFARPRAWQVLDGAIALVMWTLAALLLAGR